MSNKIEVKAVDIDTTSAGVTKLTSSSLVNALIKDTNGSVGFLSNDIAPITLDKIAVDANGRVVVSDTAFTNAMKAKLDQLAATAVLGNGTCGLGC